MIFKYESDQCFNTCIALSNYDNIFVNCFGSDWDINFISKQVSEGSFQFFPQWFGMKVLFLTASLKYLSFYELFLISQFPPNFEEILPVKIK